MAQKWGPALSNVTVGQEVFNALLGPTAINPFFYSTYQYFIHQYKIEGDDELNAIWPTVEMYLFLFGSCGILNWGMIDGRPNPLVPTSLAISEWDSNWQPQTAQITMTSTWGTETREVKGTIHGNTDWSVIVKNNQNNLPTFFPYQSMFEMVGLRLGALDKDFRVSFIKGIYGVDSKITPEVRAQFETIFNSKNLSSFEVVSVNNKDENGVDQFFDVAAMKSFDIAPRQQLIIDSIEEISQLVSKWLGIPTHVTDKAERNISNEFKYNDQYQLVMRKSMEVYRERAIDEYNAKFGRSAKLVCVYDELIEEENEGQEQDEKGQEEDNG